MSVGAVLQHVCDIGHTSGLIELGVKDPVVQLKVKALVRIAVREDLGSRAGIEAEGELKEVVINVSIDITVESRVATEIIAIDV